MTTTTKQIILSSNHAINVLVVDYEYYCTLFQLFSVSNSSLELQLVDGKEAG